MVKTAYERSPESSG